MSTRRQAAAAAAQAVLRSLVACRCQKQYTSSRASQGREWRTELELNLPIFFLTFLRLCHILVTEYFGRQSTL